MNKQVQGRNSTHMLVHTRVIPPRRTAVFAALMELLLAPHHRLAYTPNSSKAEQGWYDLVVKCMIKITKNLPATVDHINIQVCGAGSHAASSSSQCYFWSST